MILRTVFLAALWLVALSAQGQTGVCLERMKPMPDTFLRDATENVRRTQSDIEIYVPEEPCRRAENTIQDIARTVHGVRFGQSIQGFEMTTIARKNSFSFFSVERFVIENRKVLSRLDETLKRRKDNRLMVESNTYYYYFIARNNIVFCITSADGLTENKRLFDQMQQDFLSRLIADKSQTKN